MKILTFILLFILIVFNVSAKTIRITSLPNPNLLPIFIIMDKKITDLQFVPSVNGVSNIAGLIKSGKIDVAALNFELKNVFTKKFGWKYGGSFIKKAIYVLSYKPLDNKSDLEKLKIIAAFKGGSPEKLYNKLNLSNKPVFTDLMIAIKLFLKKDYDAILLPEPMISKTINLLEKKNKKYYIFDVATNANYYKPVNAIIANKEVDLNELKSAFESAIKVIKTNPDYTTKVFLTYFKKYFKRNFDGVALEKSITSGRLLFEFYE